MQRGHKKHCLVVMSHSRNPDDMGWFNSWYKTVLMPAVDLTGHIPVRLSLENASHVITDELQAHLASDPVVVVDLGGVTPEAEPSPHVLYALGLRQGLNLQYVMMAWTGQRLPFDGTLTKGVIMEGRALIDRATNRTRLRQLIQEATTSTPSPRP
jgi:hypothetical protein